MTDTTLTSITSGSHYRVTRTDGHLPRSAADFLGDSAVLLHRAGARTSLDGYGRLDHLRTGVHLYEKRPTGDDTDIRIWHIRPVSDHQMIAEHMATV